MQSKLIVMLTHHDQTVADAIQVFDECKDIPVQHWGFKNIGIPLVQMRALAQEMKIAGKTTFLEVVTYTEEECMDGARLAVELGLNYLVGTIFYDSVFQYISQTPVQFMPFCGKVHGNPSVLEGTVQEIIYDALSMKAKGVKGFDLLAYRNAAIGESLAREFTRSVGVPVVIAGSIDSFARIDTMAEIEPWGFTIGSALFDGKYITDGTFKRNLEAVVDYMAFMPRLS